MVLKASATLLISLVVFTGGIRTTTGLLVYEPATAGENASRRHGTQVRGCVSPSGNLLAFIQHWHGSVSATSSAGTMTLDTPSGQVTRSADYMLQDKSVSYLDGLCADGVSTAVITTCSGGDNYDDWAVYEFTVGSCSTSSSFTLLSGNTQVLQEGCSNLYPATISGTVACPTTNSPTPSPTNAPASAVGDPHMASITGAKFDILRPGNHTLLHIPRYSVQDENLIDVRGFVKHEGSTCLDMYIDSLHITGKWADETQLGGLSFFSGNRTKLSGNWLTFKGLELKVVHGTTSGGTKYLNLFAKHLGKVNFPVGGILGLDDHSQAATREEKCKRMISFVQSDRPMDTRGARTGPWHPKSRKANIFEVLASGR